MKFLRFGLDAPTGKRIWILILIGSISLIYPPAIYAMIIYYAYFRTWDITSTKSLKIKFLKSFMELCGGILGALIVLSIKPEMINLLLDPILYSVFFKMLIKLFIVYQTSVLLFLYIHHFGLHPGQPHST